MVSMVQSALADACLRHEEMTALQVAAVQQQLMVAALSCNAISLYNRFVVSYQRDLQTSDEALKAFFLRMNPNDGLADYHAFKTRLANRSSLRSAGTAKPIARTPMPHSTRRWGQTGSRWKTSSRDRRCRRISATPTARRLRACWRATTAARSAGTSGERSPATTGTMAS